MKFRKLTIKDCEKYKDDLFSCYKTNHLILDNQNNICINTPVSACHFVQSFIEASDSTVTGIFDDQEKYLYGIVIFDNIRFGEKSCAEVHIVNDKSIFGKRVRDIYNDIINSLPFNTIYCMIPSIAVHPIAICKKLGFKKTGYIPDALPYTNSLGEEKMYDIQIWTYRR